MNTYNYYHFGVSFTSTKRGRRKLKILQRNWNIWNISRSRERVSFLTVNKHKKHPERPYFSHFYCVLSSTCFQSTLSEDNVYDLGKKYHDYSKLLVKFLLKVYYYCRRIYDIVNPSNLIRKVKCIMVILLEDQAELTDFSPHNSSHGRHPSDSFRFNSQPPNRSNPNSW